MNLPNVDLEELRRFKEKNFQERLKFIEMYCEWIKKTPNKIWTSQHKKFIDGFLRRQQQG